MQELEELLRHWRPRGPCAGETAREIWSYSKGAVATPDLRVLMHLRGDGLCTVSTLINTGAPPPARPLPQSPSYAKEPQR